MLKENKAATCEIFKLLVKLNLLDEHKPVDKLSNIQWEQYANDLMILEERCFDEINETWTSDGVSLPSKEKPSKKVAATVINANESSASKQISFHETEERQLIADAWKSITPEERGKVLSLGQSVHESTGAILEAMQEREAFQIRASDSKELPGKKLKGIKE
jgi:hypothetical protein